MAGRCAGCQVTHETKFWAQGMDGWRKPHENAQLKWTLMIKDAGILNESEVATHCLNMLIRMCEMYPSRHRDGAIIRPLPKIKRSVVRTLPSSALPGS